MMLGQHRVERSEYGWWIYPRDGSRARFCPHGSTTARRIDAGIALDGLDKTRRAFAEGTHEPVKAWRNPDGTIGIPPHPDIAPPPDAEPFEIRTLKDADRISAEIAQEQYGRWKGDREFTANMETALGDPRKQLITLGMQSHSPLERDVIRLMLDDLENTESEREKIAVESHFHWREF